MATSTALPERLRRVLEQLSGIDLSDVRVHPDSRWPARVGARAFALGGDLHLAPGAGDTLEHEAWHVVQQRQGRVRATRAAGLDPHVGLNDDAALEHEAEVMGLVARALARRDVGLPAPCPPCAAVRAPPVLQRALTVSGQEISDVTRLELELKERAYITRFNIECFDPILADMLREDLVFEYWTGVAREVLIREAGYLAADQMQALAKDNAPRVEQYETLRQKRLKEANIRSGARNRARIAQIEDQCSDEVGLIRWGNPSYLSLKYRDSQMFQWFTGTRQAEPLRMNCWEAVVFALVKTGLVDKTYVAWCNGRDVSGEALYVKGNVLTRLTASLIRNMDYYLTPETQEGGIVEALSSKRIRTQRIKGNGTSVEVPAGRIIPRGRVLMFSGGAHFALSTGEVRNGKHVILELDSTTETVQEGSIETLKSVYLNDSIVVAPFPIAKRGSFLIKEEDTERIKTRETLHFESQERIARQKTLCREKSVRQIERLKSDVAEDQQQKIQQEEQACEEQLTRLDSEGGAWVEAELERRLSRRTTAEPRSMTVTYNDNDPYEGSVELL